MVQYECAILWQHPQHLINLELISKYLKYYFFYITSLFIFYKNGFNDFSGSLIIISSCSTINRGRLHSHNKHIYSFLFSSSSITILPSLNVFYLFKPFFLLFFSFLLFYFYSSLFISISSSVIIYFSFLSFSFLIL